MPRSRSFDWDRAEAMLKDGYTVDGICRELGCTRAALWGMRRTLGSPIRFKIGGVSAIDDEWVDRLRRQGRTYRQIAEELGVCVRTVERAVKRLRSSR